MFEGIHLITCPSSSVPLSNNRPHAEALFGRCETSELPVPVVSGFCHSQVHKWILYI